MVRTLIRREDKITERPQADRITKSASKNPLVRAVWIHLQNRRADLLFFDARIAARTDRDIHLAVRPKCNGPRQMPAAVLVTQTVIGKRRQCLRPLVGRSFFAHSKYPPRKLSGFGYIDPIDAMPVAIKLHAVRVMQSGHVRNGTREFSRPLVPVVKYIDRAALVVRQVVHVRDEDAAIRRLCKKTDAFQAFDRRSDLKLRRSTKSEASAVFRFDLPRHKPRLCDRK